jgi:hypothetical protein
MKFFQLFRKELKLSSNKRFNSETILSSSLSFRKTSFAFILIFIFVFAILIPSCSDKKEDEQKPVFSFTDSVIVNSETKKLLGDNLKFVLTGDFDEDSLQEIAAGIELAENNVWGIKFILLKLKDNQLVKEFETPLLDGSFKESLVKKIKFPKFNYELIYYNSEDYFWGSGGGEVFAYIINFAENETFYAHLFSESRKPVELFLSNNISEPDLKKFFVSSFKKDFPDLKLTSDDVSLEF